MASEVSSRMPLPWRELSSRVTNLGPIARAPDRILKTYPVARDVCMPAGSDPIADPGGAMEIAYVLNDYVFPGEADYACREVVRLLQFEMAAHALGDNLVRLDMLRRKAESRMQMGRASPGTFALGLCVQNASASRSWRSLAVASLQGNFGTFSTA